MKLFYRIFLITILFVVGFFIMKANNNSDKVLHFSTASHPFSSDPMDYDFYIHHHAFTSVFANLISLEQKGKITPVLAEKWNHDSEFKVWTFDIRNDLYYSNGDLITVKDLAQNFTRIAYLKNKAKSNSGVLEFLEGFEKIKSANDPISGISVLDQKIILKFTKPMPDLLSKIAFGFYSLAHPSLYNHTNGEWINKKTVISSGAYEVTTWTDSKFELRLRKNIPYIAYKNSIQHISFSNLFSVKNSVDLKDIDILLADKNSLMVDDTFAYVGSSIGLKIGYAQVYGWNKKSYLKNVNVRRWLRTKFYKALEESGLTPTPSFFPLSLRGINVLKMETFLERPRFDDFELVTHTMDQAMKLSENSNKKSMAEIFDSALNSLSGDGVHLKRIPIEDDSKLDEFDLVINGTGIEASDYWDTVRFMFLSKHGIQLPDETGIILKELQKNNPDINLINKEIWDQAIIWPVRHYTNGFWFKKNSSLNLDAVNLDTPAIDFQYFKWN